MLVRFYDEGDNLGPANLPDPGPATVNPGGNDEGPANLPDPGPANIDEPEIPEFKDFDSAKTEYEKLFKTYNDVSKQLKTLQTENDSHKKTIGYQGNQLSDLNKIHKLIKDNPKGYIENLARETGVAINFGETHSDDLSEVKKLLYGESSDPEKALTTLMSLVDKKAEEKLSKSLGPLREMMHDDHLAQKYKDYDDLAPAREELNNRLATGVLPRSELLHMAARATKLKEFGEAEYGRGYEKARSEYKEKYLKSIGGGGRHIEMKKLPNDPKAVLKNVLNAFN